VAKSFKREEDHARILSWGTPDSKDKNQRNNYLQKQIEIHYLGKLEKEPYAT